MSVSRRRPHDSNRGTQKNQGSAGKSPALPPILFQLPNLNSKTPAPADDMAVEDSESSVIDYSPNSGDEVVFRDTSDFEGQPAVSRETALDKLESSEPVTPATSRLEKFTSRAMTFGLIALAVAWVVVVARNVNFHPNQVTKSDVPVADVETLDILDREFNLNIDSGQLAMNPPAPTVVTTYEPAIGRPMLDAPVLNVPSEMETPAIAMTPQESSATSIFPSISLETPRMTDGAPLAANGTLATDQLAANLPSDAELKAELDAAMASMQTPAQTVSTSFPSLAEQSLESLADMTPSLESAPRDIPVQSSTPNRFDASKYAREVVHTQKKSTPTYSQTPLGVNDWTRYLPPMKTN